MDKNTVTELNRKFSGTNPEKALKYFLAFFDSRIALSSSLSLEDQILTDMIMSINPEVRIFTLDTGRLFPETYDLIDRTNAKYGIKIEIFFPNCVDVQEMVNAEGINLFYESVEKRKKCCHIRKIEPLKRAFSGLDAWICGLRKEQSVTRRDMQMIEWDEGNNLLKINPLINLSEQQVWEYVRIHNVPYNRLHDNGFTSIGCQPCTRAIKSGEDIRAGRWWWESPAHKECGLHKAGETNNKITNVVNA
ncbi:MAG: phosphoadenylyl-sulfate reductase [Prevotellaceae bacterium]|jgi:phosphoadenosine phosphosulfate reductase|nr:phosphoadenylyl-sulfate reductase [Prevotellaceae bacterium]